MINVSVYECYGDAATAPYVPPRPLLAQSRSTPPPTYFASKVKAGGPDPCLIGVRADQQGWGGSTSDTTVRAWGCSTHRTTFYLPLLLNAIDGGDLRGPPEDVRSRLAEANVLGLALRDLHQRGRYRGVGEKYINQNSMHVLCMCCALPCAVHSLCTSLLDEVPGNTHTMRGLSEAEGK